MKKISFILLLLTSHFFSGAQITLPSLQPLQYVESNFGNALNFDGVSTYGLGKVYVKDSLSDFTIEFWIKNTGSDDVNDRIYSSYYNNALHIGKNNNQLKLLATDLGGAATWQTACTLELNKWVHIAIVRNGNSLKVYKNDVVVQNYAVDAVSTLPNLFRLGSNINGMGENGNFSIDELRVWKIALSSTYLNKYMYTTINPNSTADQNPSTKLVLYYRFDQGESGANNQYEIGLYNSAITN